MKSEDGKQKSYYEMISDDSDILIIVVQIMNGMYVVHSHRIAEISVIRWEMDKRLWKMDKEAYIHSEVRQVQPDTCIVRCSHY